MKKDLRALFRDENCCCDGTGMKHTGMCPVCRTCIAIRKARRAHRRAQRRSHGTRRDDERSDTRHGFLLPVCNGAGHLNRPRGLPGTSQHMSRAVSRRTLWAMQRQRHRVACPASAPGGSQEEGE